MNILELRKLFLATLMGLAALMLLPACSSTEETTDTTSGGTDVTELEDCSVYTNQVDITECEVRNSMRQ